MLTDWFCGRDRLGLTLRQITLYVQRHLARKVQNPRLRGFTPRVFRSVSWSRNWLDNHGGYSSRISWFEDPNGWISN